MAFKPETIIATRRHFARIGVRCIRAAINNVDRVNDLPRYIAWRRAGIRASLAGESDNSFTFWQHAHYLETGECVPFLPRKVN